MRIHSGSAGLPDCLVSRARRRLMRQDGVPLSPGESCGGSVRLCAGAVLVREAVALYRSERSAERFERNVTVRDSGYIRSVASSIGLDENMVGGVIIMNDRLPARARLEGVLGYLNLLRCPTEATGATME